MAKKPKESKVTEQTQTEAQAEAVAQAPTESAAGSEAKATPTRGPRGTPESAVITVLAAENPKRAGSKAHGRFQLYRGGMSVKEFLDAGGTTPDLVYDAKHGFISIEGYNPGEVIQPKPKAEKKAKEPKAPRAKAPKADPVAAAEDAVETNEETMA